MTKDEFLKQIEHAPGDAEIKVFMFDRMMDIPMVYYIVDDPDEKTDIVISF